MRWNSPNFSAPIPDSMVIEVVVRAAGHQDQTLEPCYCVHGSILNVSNRSYKCRLVGYDPPLLGSIYIRASAQHTSVEGNVTRYQSLLLSSATPDMLFERYI